MFSIIIRKDAITEASRHNALLPYFATCNLALTNFCSVKQLKRTK